MDTVSTRAQQGALRAALVRERLIVTAALVLVILVSGMATIRTGDALMIGRYGWFAYGLLIFFMWWTMMMAMMLPSAAPAVLTFAAVDRKLAGGGRTGQFALGYVLMWTAFSAGAALLHLGFDHVLPFTGMMAVKSRIAGGLVLVGAGLYQMTPLKGACLRKCQAPIFWLGRNWRTGSLGALRMGLHHGVYCVGCCAVLMAVLFYGGVMELDWILGLALYVLAEKILPANLPLRFTSGGILIAWGLAVAWR
jgi:predicted metal-binding membrane protein